MRPWDGQISIGCPPSQRATLTILVRRESALKVWAKIEMNSFILSYHFMDDKAHAEPSLGINKLRAGLLTVSLTISLLLTKWSVYLFTQTRIQMRWKPKRCWTSTTARQRRCGTPTRRPRGATTLTSTRKINKRW